MKHKYSLFLFTNGWVFIILGVLLMVLNLFKPKSEQSFFGLYGIFIGNVFFIIDYVIQMVFEGVNHLKEMNSKLADKKPDSENKSVGNIKNDDSSLEPLPIYTKFETKKLAVKIENELNQTKKPVDKSGLIAISILLIILLYVVLIVSGFLK